MRTFKKHETTTILVLGKIFMAIKHLTFRNSRRTIWNLFQMLRLYASGFIVDVNRFNTLSDFCEFNKLAQDVN